MGADENAAIMRRAYEAFNKGDMNTLIELFDESAVWHLPGRSSMANDYQGRDAEGRPDKGSARRARGRDANPNGDDAAGQGGQQARHPVAEDRTVPRPQFRV